jgi:Na+-driven multidrug efflux pump
MSEATTPGREPPPYGPAGTRPLSRPRNGVGIAALVLGVIGLTLVLTFFFFPLGAVAAVVALILAPIGMSRASKGQASNRGEAVAGLICALVALVVAVVFTAQIGAFLAQHQDDFGAFGRCMNGAASDQSRGACVRTLGDRLETAP